MSKGEKITVILMLTVIIIYIVIGVYNTKIDELNNDSDTSGEYLNSGDNLETDDKMYYKLSSGDNEIILEGFSEGIITVTTYKFENDKLVSIILTEEVTSGDDQVIENIYDYMKTDEDMAMVYSEIEKNGNIITAVLREEYVDSYGDSDKKEVYNKLKTALELSEG